MVPHYLRNRRLLLIGVWALAALPQVRANAAGPNPLPQHTYELTVDEQGRLAGPGGRWLLQHAADCRFVLFGEAHHLNEVPLVVDAVHAALCKMPAAREDATRGAGAKSDRVRPTSAWHLALEMGPWTAHRIDSAGLPAIVAQHPFSIAFDGNTELDLLANAQARGARIFGLDQEITAIHPLQRLLEIANTPELKKAAQAAMAKAVGLRGEYIRTDHFEDIERLHRAFEKANALTPEAQQIFEAVEISMQIYRDYRTRDTALTGYRNADTRERYMKENLLAAYRAAEKADEPARFVIKLGGAHVMEGIGPNRVRTLGNFVQEWAESMGSDALHIAIHPLPEDGSAKVFGKMMEKASFLLVDCRALRPRLIGGRLNEATLPMAQQELLAYDAILYIRNATPASHDRINAAKQRLAASFGVSLNGKKNK
jgi:hypothetical protein